MLQRCGAVAVLWCCSSRCSNAAMLVVGVTVRVAATLRRCGAAARVTATLRRCGTASMAATLRCDTAALRVAFLLFFFL
jgi:hypothetical protein